MYFKAGNKSAGMILSGSSCIPFNEIDYISLLYMIMKLIKHQRQNCEYVTGNLSDIHDIQTCVQIIAVLCKEYPSVVTLL